MQSADEPFQTAEERRAAAILRAEDELRIRTSFPPIDPALVRALEDYFPHRSPVMGESIESIWRRAGQCDAVQLLREVMARQSEDHLLE